MLEIGDYKIEDPDGLETPAMVVFEAKLDGNIAAVCELVGGGQNLVVHVKTHKSDAVTRKQVEAGVAGFKCATLKELEMVLDAGAGLAIQSYPQVQKLKVDRLSELAAEHPEDAVCALASNRQHLSVLSAVGSERSRPLSVMIDLDVGMHRTGVGLREAEDLYAAIDADAHLVAAGLHIYDGHEHMTDTTARAAAAQRHIEDVQKLKGSLEAKGMDVPRVVGGGTFSFAYYARTDGMMGSPGTCVYWDTGYASQMPDMPFQYAALILTQVVDAHPDHKTITTDLGYKAIAGDPPLKGRATLLGAEEATLLLQNEEHGVFHWTGEDPPAVGSYFLAVPGHVCPTTIRYPGSFVIDPAGAVVDYYPHTARDRQ